MDRPVLLVVGSGPGLGRSVAMLYARDGYDVALLGNDHDALTQLATELEGLGSTVRTEVADLADVEAGRAAVSRLADAFGHVEVLHFNPSAFREKDPLELTVADLLADVAVGVGALLTSIQAARPSMSTGGRVTVTGSMAADEPWNRAASLGVQKAGIRNLVHSLDATLEPDGIRAVSVTVQGALAREGAFTPDRVAEAIHAAAHQDEASWRSEILYSGQREVAVSAIIAAESA